MNDSYTQYIVGNELMDREHSVLIDIFVRLVNGKNIEYIIYDLLKYSIEHFDHEEALMESVGYSDLASHKKQHKWFIARVTDVIKSETYNNENIKSFLHMWLLNHINVCDRDLAEFIKLRNDNERIS